MSYNSKITAILATLAILGSAGLAQAKNASLSSKFSVYYKGVPVATLKNNVVIKGNSYRIDGVARTNKFVSVIAKSKGFISASGTIAGTKVIPKKQSVSFKRGKKRGDTSIVFKGSNVVKVSASPKPKIKPDTVRLKPSHSRNVLDPISALVFPVKNGNSASGDDVCNRNIGVFDGKSRMNLRFRYKGRSKARVSGYRGPVYRCSVKYTPVAGHRKSNKGTNFMKKRNDIEIRMARIGNSNVFGLIGFTVPTRVGVISGEATKFSSK